MMSLFITVHHGRWLLCGFRLATSVLLTYIDCPFRNIVAEDIHPPIYELIVHFCDKKRDFWSLQRLFFELCPSLIDPTFPEKQ